MYHGGPTFIFSFFLAYHIIWVNNLAFTSMNERINQLGPQDGVIKIYIGT